MFSYHVCLHPYTDITLTLIFYFSPYALFVHVMRCFTVIHWFFFLKKKGFFEKVFQHPTFGRRCIAKIRVDRNCIRSSFWNTVEAMHPMQTHPSLSNVLSRSSNASSWFFYSLRIEEKKILLEPSALTRRKRNRIGGTSQQTKSQTTFLQEKKCKWAEQNFHIPTSPEATGTRHAIEVCADSALWHRIPAQWEMVIGTADRR